MNFRILVFFFIQSLFNIPFVYSQFQRCATTEVLERMKKDDPELVQRMQVIQKNIQFFIEHTSSFKTGNGIITIPVVVHKMHHLSIPETNIPDSIIYSQIEVLNEDFRKLNADTTLIPAEFKSVAADVKVEFCLAKQDYYGFPTTGIIYKMVSAASFTTDDKVKSNITDGSNPWPTDKYLNIWVCNLSGGLLGYSTMPGADSSIDGVVIDYQAFGRDDSIPFPFNMGRTTTHEAGHWLGLYHTFKDGCAGDSTSNCAIQGDFICDTPPVDSATYGCPSLTNTCIEYPVDQNDMTSNYMEFVVDSCMNLFTNQQALRIAAVLNTERASIKSSMGCMSIVPEDAGIANIIDPAGNICIDSIAPFIQIINYGTDTLDSVKIYYRIDTGILYQYNWVGSLLPLNSANITLPYINLASGNHIFTAFTALPNGITDIVLLNDTSKQTFFVDLADTLVASSFIQDFETGGFPPDNLSINNPDADITWWPTYLLPGIDGQATNATYINCFNYSNDGEIDELITAHINLSNASNPVIIFDVAYAMYNSFNYEKLYVLVSDDCGNNYTQVYFKQGSNLRTIAPLSQTTEWFPTSANHWRREVVDLSTYAGKSIIVKFRAINGYGNNLFLDNININFNSSLDLLSNNYFIPFIAPNPSADGLFSLSFRYSKVEKIEINIFNTLGELIQHAIYTTYYGNNKFTIDISNNFKGMYYINIKSKNHSFNTKLIKH